MSTNSNTPTAIEQRFLRNMLRHTVAIAGTYRHATGADRMARAYAYSGSLVELGEDIEVTGHVLADCFGTGAQHFAPLPFRTIRSNEAVRAVER